ncbi:MAG TPA: plastocyanin/azurin family copper-binding protein [Balneolaceae bacterium]|nr:plastocyanin/azurin family copper-binding protein [Balneolaceae bacterium]
MMKIIKYLLPGLCLLVLVLIINGCSKGVSKTPEPTTHTVVIEGMQFKPTELSVSKGDTIKWVNKDIVTHNVTEYPDEKWTSGPININDSWKKVIDEEFDYYCSIHPTMKGKIILK